MSDDNAADATPTAAAIGEGGVAANEDVTNTNTTNNDSDNKVEDDAASHVASDDGDDSEDEDDTKKVDDVLNGEEDAQTLVEKDAYPKLYKFVLDKLFNAFIRSIPHARENQGLMEEINNWESYLFNNKQLLDMAKSKKFARLMNILKKRFRESPMVAENNERLDLLKESAKTLKSKATDYYEESATIAKDVHQTSTGQEIESKLRTTLKLLIHHPNSVEILAEVRKRFIELEEEAAKANLLAYELANAQAPDDQTAPKRRKRSIRQGWMDVLNKLIEALNEENPSNKVAPGALAEQVVLWFNGLEEIDAPSASGTSTAATGKNGEDLVTKKDDLVRKNAKRLRKYVETVQERTKVKGSDALDGVVKMVPKIEDFAEKVAARVREMKSKGKFDEYSKTALEQITDDRRKFLEKRINNVVPKDFVKYCEQIFIDKEARRKFVDWVKDETVNLFLNYLPSINIPPLEGEKDGVNYSVKGLDLSGFAFTKDNISVKLASVEQVKLGEPFITVVVDDISAKMKNLDFNFQQTFFPFFKAEGNADALVKGASFIVGTQVFRGFAPDDEDDAGAGAGGKEGEDNATEGDAAPESNSRSPSPAIAAASAKEKRRLTGYPLDKGVQEIKEKFSRGNEGGEAENTDSEDGGDDKAKKEKKEKNTAEHPRFRVGIVRVSIDSITLNIHGTPMSWFYNGITDVFSHNIKTYVISLIQDGLEEQLTKVTDAISDEICDRWKLINSSLEVDLTLLAAEETAVARAAQLYSGMASRKDVYSVTFTGHGPLGIALAQKKEYVVVRGFRRLPNNHTLPGEKCGKIRPGDVLVGYNGQEIESLPLDRVHARLKKSPRPLTLSFIPGTAFTAEGELKSVEESLASAKSGAAGAKGSSIQSKFGGRTLSKIRNKLRFRGADPSDGDSDEPISVTFKDQKLYMLIKARKDNACAAVVTGFRLTEKGDKGAAEKCGKIKVGYILTRIGTQSTKNLTFDQTFDIFKDAPRPVTLEFMSDCDFDVEFTKERPIDLKVNVFTSAPAANGDASAPTAAGTSNVVITGFKHIPGPAEVQCGDSLRTGFIVSRIGDVSTEGVEFDAVIARIKESVRPVTIKFAIEPPSGTASAEEAENDSIKVKECFATFQEGPLGIIFYRRPEDKRCAFKAFVEYPGPGKRTGKIDPGDVLVSINGNPLPLDEKEIEKLIQESPLPVSLVVRDMAQFAALQEPAAATTNSN